jgi:hypothetical protein
MLHALAILVLSAVAAPLAGAISLPALSGPTQARWRDRCDPGQAGGQYAGRPA